jgi:predicted ATP-dependent endonuclease of OLD family
MRIKSFKYRNKALEWKLEPVNFENFTLLIGASGVGKTLILDAIIAVKEIADGASLKGIEWEIEFETTDDLKYKWNGAFENKGIDTHLYRLENKEKIPERNMPPILYENVYLNEKQIVKRSKDEIIFNGGKTPKLSQQESIIRLLKEEDAIAPAYRGFKKIIFNDYPELRSRGVPVNIFDIQKLLEKYKTLESIRESDEDIETKLFLVYRNIPSTFKKIKTHFIEFFPQVEDIKIEPLESEGDMPPFIKERAFIQIKEMGVNRWIYQFRVSSGMLRTLIHIGELYLASEETVILIDEFENSLGINCIDDLTAELLSAGRNLQFIITSHHPYIINNVDFKHWKLVTRNAGVVKTLESRSLNLGKSKHDAFIQLLNLDQYKDGIRVELE